MRCCKLAMYAFRPLHLTALALLLPALLAGCSSTPTTTVATPSAVPESPRAPAPVKPVVGHFEAALDLLQKGQPQQAEAELLDCLRAAPDNKAARNLVTQINSPLDKLFPASNFSVQLSKDESLSSLAKTYLGDPLSFYALARYNGIIVPAKVNVGQTIKIPKTANAIVAQQARDAAAQHIVETPVPAAVPKSKPDPHKFAEREFKKGVIAFQRQDLDGAIAAWDKALTIEPNYQDAQLNRAQALRLKENLKKLQH